MGKFKKDNRFGGGKNPGGKSFGNRDSGGRGFGGRDRDMGRPSMHKAVCDECGESCEVPFKPTGDKPIYCSNCFQGKRGGDDSRNLGGRNRERPSFGDRSDRQMYSAKCDACGNACEVPFKPSGDKPVYCEECFSKNKRGGSDRGGSAPRGGDGQLKDQLNALNAKLDKILRMLGGEEKQGSNPPKVDKETKKPKVDWKKEEIGDEAEAKEIASVIAEMKAMDVTKETKSGKKEKAIKPAKPEKAKAPAKKVAAKKKK